MNHTKAKQVLIITLALNALVAFLKIFIGFLTGALSILSDGFHSLFDGVSNLVGLAGLRISEKPHDSTHPYGHRKFESLAALSIAVLISITAYEFLKNTIERFIRPTTPEITILSLAVIAATVAIDFFVYRYENFWGKKLKSQILIADSLHTKTHLITTPSVLIAMLAIRAGYPVFDPLIAFFVVLSLGKLAWEIFRETSSSLCDQAVIDTEKIQELVRQNNAIKSSHQIRTRGDEHHVFLDMHIVLHPSLSLEEAHRVSQALKQNIMQNIPQVKDVIIHIEPDGGECQCK